jgi:hypothetical protein
VKGVEIGVWDKCHLPEFLAELAADFQGWAGVRTLYVSYLVLEAEYHSRGRVRLAWTVRPWYRGTGSWSATITTWLEAGEQMRNLADELSLFLPLPGQPT